MKKLLIITSLCLFAALSLSAAGITPNNPLYGTVLAENIPNYQNFGVPFTKLASEIFWKAFLGIIIAFPIIFALHYFVIGAKTFSHEGKKIYVFSVCMRTFHWIAALAFVILVPTGLVMVFGNFFGGGAFVRSCKNLHAIATVIFALSVIPIIVMMIKDMFPAKDDIKWAMMMGGYLSKKKREIPAGKFNAGQKVWFWIAIPGGFVMILTGAFMFFLNYDLTFFSKLFSTTQIELLRVSAMVHNIFGMLIVVMFFVHVYMSVFAIKGSLHSMIDGHKSEEEVALMHSSWYKKLKKRGEV